MRLVIIDDHPLFRDGVEQMLRAEWPQAEVVCASSAEAGMSLVRLGADLVILDLTLPGMTGASAVVALQSQCSAPIVVLTASEDRRDLEASIRAGARAYLTKATSPDILLATLARVLAGEVVLTAVNSAPMAGGSPGLTARQREILLLMCHGFPNKEIALRLDLGETTVKSHVAAIFSTLGVVNRTQAVLAAQRYGWVAAP